MLKNQRSKTPTSEPRQVSFSLPELTGELPLSVSKSIPELEEGSQSLKSIKHLEHLLIHYEWTHEVQKDWFQLKYFSQVDSAIYIQLNFKETLPSELILKVLNEPEHRLLWDTSYTEIKLLEGSSLLDAKLQTTKKGAKTPTEVTRVVRLYKGALVVMNFADLNPQEEDWVKGSKSVLGFFVWQNSNNTLIEMVMQDTQIPDIKNEAKKAKQWIAKFYQELLSLVPINQ